MSTLPVIETLSDDNEKSYFRSQRIRTKSKTVVTPTRSLEPRRSALLPEYDTSPYSMVELFNEFDSDSIRSLQGSRGKVDELESRLRRLDRRGHDSAARVCFSQFRPGLRRLWPTDDELSFLTDVSHSYSDVVPIPSVATAVELPDLDGFFSHVTRAIRLIERMNNKPLMGWIPVAMPRAAYSKLIDAYLKRDVRTFYVDFAGRTPSNLQTRPILTHLSGRRALSGSVLYGLNARPGKFVKNAKEIPSRDFFLFGYGLDVLGGSHLRAFVPPSSGAMSNLDREVAKRAANRRRLFVRATYGYHQVDSISEAESLLPKRLPIVLRTLLTEPDRAIEKAFNMDQQRYEAAELTRRLGELGKRESILDYVAAKRLAREAVPTFRRQPTLM